MKNILSIIILIVATPTTWEIVTGWAWGSFYRASILTELPMAAQIALVVLAISASIWAIKNFAEKLLPLFED